MKNRKQQIMKNKLHRFLVLIVCLLGIQEAFGRSDISNNLDGLTVSAQAFYFTSAGVPKLNVVVQLLNTTNHDITVLTKNPSSRYFNLSADKTKFRFWFLLDSDLKWGGHPVVPSLSELSPVILKPNEVALCHMIVEQNDESKTLQGLAKDSSIVISYEILPSLGKRFDCWSGRIDTKSFNASIATIPVKTP